MDATNKNEAPAGAQAVKREEAVQPERAEQGSDQAEAAKPDHVFSSPRRGFYERALNRIRSATSSGGPRVLGGMGSRY